MDDIKKQAEQYAHSYPFAKVADAYEAGALAEIEKFSQWENLFYEPIVEGKYLLTVTLIADRELISSLYNTRYGDKEIQSAGR